MGMVNELPWVQAFCVTFQQIVLSWRKSFPEGEMIYTESVSIPKPEFASRLPEYLRQSWIDDLKKIMYILSKADALLLNERNN